MASRYDVRMQEIAAQRQAEREGLDRIEESTETINRGMSDPINWLLCIGAFVLIPASGGLSIGLAIVAVLRATAGGKANIQAIQPTMADVAAPGLGCARIFGALGVLVGLGVLILMFAAVVAYNAGVKP